jgi:hypothetical protein
MLHFLTGAQWGSLFLLSFFWWQNGKEKAPKEG